MYDRDDIDELDSMGLPLCIGLLPSVCRKTVTVGRDGGSDDSDQDELTFRHCAVSLPPFGVRCSPF